MKRNGCGGGAYSLHFYSIVFARPPVPLHLHSNFGTVPKVAHTAIEFCKKKKKKKNKKGNILIDIETI